MAEPPIPVRYVILLELVRSGPLRASELVDPTGLTLQGVSYNLKQLAGDGLVSFETADTRQVRITQEGIEALHDHFLGLKAFVDVALSDMLPIEECVALAGQALEAGQEVGLFMEAGQLVARSTDSPSQGTVGSEAQAGELVVVSGLSGVVDLAPGTIHLVALPPPDTLPTPTELTRWVAEQELEADVLVLSGLEAEVLGEQAGLEELEGPIRFGAAHAARHAASLGLDVLLLASRETAETLVDQLEDRSEGGPSLARYDAPQT